MTETSEQRFRTGDEQDPKKVIRDLQSLDAYIVKLEARIKHLETLIGYPYVDEGLITDVDLPP